MVPSKIHARIGVSAAAVLLGCTMSVVLVRSGGARLTPAIFVNEPTTITEVPAPLAEPLPQQESSFPPGPMLVATPANEPLARLPLQPRSR